MPNENSKVLEATAILIIFAVIIIMIFVGARKKQDEVYDLWMSEVKRLAPFHGYKQEDIDQFDMLEWEDFFLEGMDPETAIKHKLSVND